jgi:hypothetical protein
MSWLAAQAPRAAPDAPGAGGTFKSTALADAGRLSMYAEAPRGDVAIEDFESAALDRLKGDEWGGMERCGLADGGPRLAPARGARARASAPTISPSSPSKQS